MTKRAFLSFAAATAVLGLSTGMAQAQPYGPMVAHGGYAYAGDDYPRGGRSEGRFFGPGAHLVDPWLADTDEGWYIVTRGFRGTHDGYVDEDVAHRANIWFRRYADADDDMRLTDFEIRRALAWAVTGPTIADVD